MKKKASDRRELLVRNPATNQLRRYSGEQVYSITPLGVVTSVSRSRIFYPWSKVEHFIYDVEDSQARKIIQGY